MLSFAAAQLGFTSLHLAQPGHGAARFFLLLPTKTGSFNGIDPLIRRKRTDACRVFPGHLTHSHEAD